MIKKCHFILTILGFTCFSCSNAQPGKETLASFIQQKTDSLYKKESLPGIFVGILNNGEKTYYNAGFAVPEKQMPFDSATIFEIGSITKTFTAYVLMAVLMENNISETDFIVKYLPDSVQKNKKLDSISFSSLMNHTSGLPRLPENMKLVNKNPYDDYSSDNLYAYLTTCAPKPDGKSNYSNLGAGLAGALAASISGKTYNELVTEHILQPFTKTWHVKADASNKSQGYFSKTEKIDFWNMNVLAPAGGLKCSANQMLGYLANMCFPQTDISKTIVNKLTTQTVSLNPRLAVGLGWHIMNSKDQPPVYWHNGGTYGFSTFCAFLKDKSKAVIVVVNQFNKNAVSDALGAMIIKKMMSEE